MVSIKGLDKRAVLAALYNASRPQGMGFLHYDPKPMTKEDAEALLPIGGMAQFDYLKGRVMKVNLSRDDEFDEWGYDRDNGAGAAAAAIASLRAEGSHGGAITLGLSDVATKVAPAVDRAIAAQKGA